jgi:hypothetical protein
MRGQFELPVLFGHTATLIGTNIMIFGGYSGDGDFAPLNHIFVIDTSKKRKKERKQ